jgi:hypothetical protein
MSKKKMSKLKHASNGHTTTLDFKKELQKEIEKNRNLIKENDEMKEK